MQTEQNIRLEGKPSVWRWLLPLIIIIVLGAIVWAYYESNKNITTQPTQTTDQNTTQPY